MQATLKVSSRSAPNAVAGALAHLARAHDPVAIQVVGAAALNQAIKALAIARTYVAPAGLDLSCRPAFAEIEISGEARTAIRLVVDCRPAEPGPATAAGVAGPEHQGAGWSGPPAPATG